MFGKIYPDTRASCSCKKALFNKAIKAGKIDVPVCSVCLGFPDRFRISAYYPDHTKKSGRSRTGDIRYDDQGNRIDSMDRAVYMLKQIEKEIEQGSFNPDKYVSQRNREAFLLKNIINEYLAFSKSRIEDPDYRITKRTFRDKTLIAKNHLTPLFGTLDIQFLSSGIIKNKFRQVTTNRRRVHEEINSLLKFAKDELEIVFQMPAMPKKPSKNMRAEEEIPNIHALEKISTCMDDVRSRVLVRLLGITLLRPCDLLPLKESNLDFDRLVLRIDCHDSEGSLVSGRKSDSLKKSKSVFTTPLTKFIIEEIKHLEFTGRDDNYLFKNKRGGDSYMSYSTLNNAWIRARKKAAIKFNDESLSRAQLYTATKHAGVTQLLEMGVSFEKIMRITGIGREALEHYSKLKANSVLSEIENLSILRFKKQLPHTELSKS